MQTQPVIEVIPREISNPEIEKVLGQFSSGIEETVNFGSHILKWSSNVTPSGDKDIPLILSFRHILELLDAISILVKHSSIDPCKLLLRGILESYFGLEYLFETDTKKRAMAFMVWHIHHNLKLYQKVDPSTEQGKQFRKTLQEDRSVGGMKIPEFPQLPLMINNLNSLLTEPAYVEAEAEYQRLRVMGKKNPAWYSFYDGPKNIEQLARHLGLSGMYEVLYRGWSGPMHGTDIIQGKIFSDDKGGSLIVQIRYIEDAQTVTNLALSFAFKTYRLFIEYYIPDKKIEYQKWYAGIRDFYMKVSGQPIIKVE